MLTLTAIEKQLLYHLSLNGRMSVTELGNRLSVSKQRVSYLMKKLSKNGVIIRFHSITNVYTLGKAHYRVFIKLGQIDFPKEKELRRYLMKHPDLAWVIYLDGDFDILLVVWANNVIDFEKIYDEIMGRYGRYFQEKYFSIVSRIEYLPYSFLDPPHPSESGSLIFGNHFSNYQLGNLDKKILSTLNRKGRESFAQISADLNISIGNLNKRVQKMVQAGVIIEYHVKIDHRLLSFEYQKVLLKLNDFSPAQLMKLTSFLKGKKAVVYLLKTIGSYDFEFELMSASNSETFAIIKELRLTFAHNIKSHHLVVFKDEAKSEDLKL